MGPTLQYGSARGRPEGTLAPGSRRSHERVAKGTPYSGEQDWVFPSFKLKGDKPRVANMLVEDHLRPAAIAAGVLKEGESVRFGFHNLRHSLASFLVQAGTNPKTVQTLLRHTDVHTTLQIYAHSRNEDRMTAQGDMLTAFFAPPTMVQ